MQYETQLAIGDKLYIEQADTMNLLIHQVHEIVISSLDVFYKLINGKTGNISFVKQTEIGKTAFTDANVNKLPKTGTIVRKAITGTMGTPIWESYHQEWCFLLEPFDSDVDTHTHVMYSDGSDFKLPMNGYGKYWAFSLTGGN